MPLHVANGHSTTGLIEQSGVPGRTMIWCDPLYDGPVPGGVSDDELLLVRARFLAASPDEVDDVAAELASWRSAVSDPSAHDELVLWFEHDLFDQLNLIQLLTHLGRDPMRTPVSLVCVDAYPGHPDFKGLGELTPENLASLFAGRAAVTAAQLSLAARAWEAFRSPDPRAIEALIAGDTSALPFLSRALARHLEEFPSAEGGLSRSERRIMEQAVDGPVEIRQAFPNMHAGEQAFYITDRGFFDRASDLACATPSLVNMYLSKPDAADAMPAGTIGLTGEGRAVLAGTADRVRLCGIDRWLGGVHLAGRGPVWRWSEGAGRLIEA
jgi:hypothetical protein